MSHKTSLRVWEHSQTQRAARCLMLALADFANDDGICWPGTALLSKKINESPDYTDTIIKKCIEMGELAKHAGRGRGHPSRFAILCGLDPDAQRKLKGVLEKGYPSTPFTKGVSQTPLSDKRGTGKGVLIDDKRGTFLDANYHANGASEPSEARIVKNEIQDDPGGGIDPPPPALPKTSGGGGGDSYETDVRQLLGGYNILGAAKVATQYAALSARPSLDDIRAAVLSMAGSDPQIPNRIYRRLMDCPPPWPELRARAVAQPPPPPAPVAGLSAEQLRGLKDKHDYTRRS